MIIPNCINMHKVTLIGNMIQCDGRSCDISSVVGLTLTQTNLSIAMFDGSVLSAEPDGDLFYKIGDQCPWASKALS